ncbi:MAG: glycosyltransferase [Flavobacteriaceae bacterium]|nr:glycosyltransferase [Flavobacteriaceae bacterium]
MEQNISVSVIIPVYNVQKYLFKCLDSVVNQSLQNIEIIIINDCSPDNSEEIINQFSKKDDRIRYFKNKNNIGIGYTRNDALLKAKGEYICFLDSDDYIELNSLEKLYKKSKEEDLDILEGRYYKIEKNLKSIYPKTHQQIESVITGQEYVDQLSSIMIVVWSKMWKRTFLLNNNLRFKKRKYEDVNFTLESFTIAKRVSNIDLPFYNYFVRENSTMTSEITESRLQDSLELVKDLEQLYLETKGQLINPKIEEFFFNGFVTILSSIVRKSDDRILRLEFSKKVIQIYKKYRFDILRAKNLGIINKILLFISPRLMSKFYFFYKKLKLRYN